MSLLKKLFKQNKPSQAPQPSKENVGVSESHQSIYRTVSPYTMTSKERVFAMLNAIDYLTTNKIEGEFIECGVWKGGSCMAMIKELISLNDTTRSVHLFDTFEGMPPPKEVDAAFHGQSAQEMLDTSDPDTSNVWAKSSLDEVKSNISSLTYDPSKIFYHEGKVEETLLNDELPEKIALLRLDTDWYESTKVEMEVLFPKLVSGGVLIIDDYGHWQGCKKAIDEYIAKNDIKLLLNRIDYTGRIAIKL